jgi:hypothetical protein
MHEKELCANNAETICLPHNMDRFTLELSEVYIRNLQIRSEEVSVVKEFIIETGKSVASETRSVPATRFIFNEGQVRSLLYKVLEATGQLDGLEGFIKSGGIINKPEGQSYGGGFDIVIEHKQIKK